MGEGRSLDRGCYSSYKPVLDLVRLNVDFNLCETACTSPLIHCFNCNKITYSCIHKNKKHTDGVSSPRDYFAKWL